jgi:putative oxidoreductase
MLETIRKDGTSTDSHPLRLLPERAALGSTMLYHGIQKLRDAENVGLGFESLGIAPGRKWALATGAAETFAGAATILGVLTRPAALAVLATQSVAIAKVHRKKGFDTAKGGFEWNLALMAIAADLLFAGPGRLSVNRGVFSARRRRRSRLARVAAALLG